MPLENEDYFLNYCLARSFQEVLHASPTTVHNNSVLVAQFYQLKESPELREEYLQLHICDEKKEKWTDDFNRSIDDEIFFSVLGDENFPEEIAKLPYSPFVLSFKGTPVWMTGPGLAVVGSREASSESLLWMERELSLWLKRTESYLISGGARGTDQKAHELCLRIFRPTVVVLPSGLGNIYPPKIQDWQRNILQAGGAILSEYAFSQEIHRHFFVARNRLISALGAATLIIQASRRSGTLITAKHASEQGKALLVLPSHPLQVSHLGNLDLILEGATPVVSADDLVAHFAAEVFAWHRD